MISNLQNNRKIVKKIYNLLSKLKNVVAIITIFFELFLHVIEIWNF